MKWSKISTPRALLVGLIVALAIGFFLGAGTSSASLGAYNPAWDGTSSVRTTAEAMSIDATIAQNTSAYGTVLANKSIAFVLSPDQRYSELAAGDVSTFVRSGGTLLVAADYGEHGNDLLAAVGVDARLNGTPLRDEQKAGPSPAFPRATATANHTYTDGVDTVVLNHGTSIEVGTATPLVSTSEFSYLDTSRNQALDESEVLQRRPVVTIEPLGEGHVIVVSDPSIFLNAMLDRGDNEAFLRELLGAHQRVILDVSHTNAVPPLIATQLAIQESGLLLFVGGTLSILAVVFGGELSGKSTWLSRQRQQTVQPPSPSADEIAAAIRDRHPDWDDERVERVTDSLIRHHQQRSNDD